MDLTSIGKSRIVFLFGCDQTEEAKVYLVGSIVK